LESGSFTNSVAYTGATGHKVTAVLNKDKCSCAFRRGNADSVGCSELTWDSAMFGLGSFGKWAHNEKLHNILTKVTFKSLDLCNH
jgi:hypothetical protein